MKKIFLFLLNLGLLGCIGELDPAEEFVLEHCEPIVDQVQDGIRLIIYSNGKNLPEGQLSINDLFTIVRKSYEQEGIEELKIVNLIIFTNDAWWFLLCPDSRISLGIEFQVTAFPHGTFAIAIKPSAWTSASRELLEIIFVHELGHKLLHEFTGSGDGDHSNLGFWNSRLDFQPLEV